MDPVMSSLPITKLDNISFQSDDQVMVDAPFTNGNLKRASAPDAFGYENVQNIETFTQEFDAYIAANPSNNPQIKIKLHFDGLPLDAVKYDIFDPSFQNLSLKLLDGMDAAAKRKLESCRNLAQLTLIRAHNMAVGSRADVSWEGKLLEKPDADKQKALEAHKESLHLYNWQNGAREGYEVDGKFDTESFVLKSETLKAVDEAIKMGFAPSEIGFLIMAHPENLLGGGQGGFGAQEESEAPKTDSPATLSNIAYFEDGNGCGNGKHVEDKHKGRIRYNLEHQLGAGKNHSCKTRIINSDIKEDVTAIFHAFVNFSDYKVMPEGEDYDAIVEKDVRATARTAKAEGVTVLIAGATGCGVFKHDPVKEAAAWKKIVNEPEFKGHFKALFFAILVFNDRDQKNFDAFTNAFIPKEEEVTPIETLVTPPSESRKRKSEGETGLEPEKKRFKAEGAEETMAVEITVDVKVPDQQS